jgi:hypothetical protein
MEVFYSDAGKSEQIHFDPEFNFPHNLDAMFPKQIEILVYAAMQRVFNRNDRERRPPSDNILKYLVESFARDGIASLSEVRFRRLLAECAGLTLVGYF